MAKIGRIQRSAGRDKGSWLVTLLAVVILIPTASVLWFMTRAMQNERLAVQQKLGEAYRSHLILAQERLAGFWRERGRELDRIAEQAPGPAVFARCWREGLADSVVSWATNGAMVYPGAPQDTPDSPEILDVTWQNARQLEHVQLDLINAAAEYAKFAGQTTNTSWIARSLQAQARCLVRAGQKEPALRLLTETLAEDRFAQSLDADGRLTVANAELRALELGRAGERAALRPTLDRLKKRLSDYENSVMPAAQRRFLMRELRAQFPAETEFPTLAAEELAARFLETRSATHPSVRVSVLQPTQLSNVWLFVSPSGRLGALYQLDSLRTFLQTSVVKQAWPSDVAVRLWPPTAEVSEKAFAATLAAGSALPGWQLGLTESDRRPFEAAVRERLTSYLWTGLLVVAAMSILAGVMVRALRQQIELTRLKNDLVAAVTHELKTPLSSMRLLVDTLLADEKSDPKTTREYLELIAKENSRLSRLIDNFLAFSRMERNKYALQFRETTVREVLDPALEAVRDRLEGPGCRFDVEVAPGLPPMVADADAWATVVINLLDNAYKYTGDAKEIRLRVDRIGAKVAWEIRDNGIGIAPRESKKIFKRFYQVDSGLARSAGGCGLGLSIVQFIVTAHRGEIRLESQPGQGSTFTVLIPAAPAVSSGTTHRV